MNLTTIAANEPALITGFVTAVLAALIAFGVPITPEQKVALAGLAVPVVAIVGAFITRATVTPVAKS